MLLSVISRLVGRLRDGGGRSSFREFLKAMRQADVVGASFHDAHVFRPRLEVLEERLAPAVTFAAQATFAAGPTAFGEAVADLNGDGMPDIITANPGAKNGSNQYYGTTISVLLNITAPGATAASFAPPQTFTAGNGPFAVAVGDINGDGLPDIAVANNTDNTVSIFMNTTTPGSPTVTFAPQETFAVGSNPRAIAFADLNGDGRPDLIISNTASNSISVLMNLTPIGATSATFGPQQTFGVSSGPDVGLAVGDLNGDGLPDVAVGCYSSVVSVLLNTTPANSTTASFESQQTFTTGTGSDCVAMADLTGDGRPDLIVANYDGGNASTVSVLMNTTIAGSTLASFASQTQFAIGSGPLGIAVGDFTGDGRPDIAVANGGSANISVLENISQIGGDTVQFANQQTFATGTTPRVLVAADFNSDGLEDIVATNAGASQNNVSVFLNNLPPLALTVTQPAEVADFPGAGVFQFNQALNSWASLTVSDPTVLANNTSGWVVGSFGAYGVNLYQPGYGWKMITPSAASNLAMDGLGDIVGSFPGYGVFYYRPATGVWTLITPDTANQVALDAYGNVYGTFSGYGILEYSLAAASWRVLNSQTPTTFAVNALDEIVASFPSYGVHKFIPYIGTWIRLTTSTATSVAINTYGTIIANFPSYGVDQITPTASTWTSISPSQGSGLAIDRYGNSYGAFSPYGTYFIRPLQSSWTQDNQMNAALLSLADYPFALGSPFAG